MRTIDERTEGEGVTHPPGEWQRVLANISDRMEQNHRNSHMGAGLTVLIESHCWQPIPVRAQGNREGWAWGELGGMRAISSIHRLLFHSGKRLANKRVAITQKEILRDRSKEGAGGAGAAWLISR